MKYGILKDNVLTYVSADKIETEGETIIMPSVQELNKNGIYEVNEINSVGTDEIVNGVILHYIGNVRTLEQAKLVKIADIEAYDSSEYVNSFTYNGTDMWVDKATRVGLVNAVDSAIILGKESVTIGFGGVPVNIDCDKAKKMLAEIELYALDCYNITASHKVAVNSLESVEEVDGYDYKIGYPEKLNF